MSDSTATPPTEPTRPTPAEPEAARAADAVPAPAIPPAPASAAVPRDEPRTPQRSTTSTSATSSTPATPAKPAKPMTPERRARRGATIAGAIALPLVTAGFALLAVPLAIWQLATIVKTLVVVVANAVAGAGAAADANATLASIDPNAMSGITIAFAIVGAVLLLAGAVVSVLVLRSHGVRRPAMVTVVALPMGSVVAAIVTGTVGALGGLLFGTSDTVSEVLGNAAIAIALTAIGSGIATIVTGALVWLWMAGIFHERAETAKR